MSIKFTREKNADKVQKHGIYKRQESVADRTLKKNRKVQK